MHLHYTSILRSATACVLAVLCVVACAPSEQLSEARKFRREGKPEQAMTLLRSAQLASPDDPKLLSDLGYTLLDMAEPREAREVFERLIAHTPQDAYAHNGRAVALDMLGDHAAARPAYDQALSLAPGALNIQNNLGMSMIMAGEVKDAVALLAPLLVAHPKNEVIRQNLALAHALSGDWKKARALNLETLSEEETKKNMAFYKAYAKRRGKAGGKKTLQSPPDGL